MRDVTPSQDAIVIERVLDADVALVWRMWTDPEHFASWYGPTGATVTVIEMEVRVGGRRQVGMEMPTPDGPRHMWFTGEHLEVAEGHRLAYTESMADEEGNVRLPSDMGMPASHPTTTEVVVELVELDGGTKMTMTHRGVPSDSPGAMGWNMAFDKLTAALAAGA